MIILASTSPRRIELLKTIVNDFVSIQPSYEEVLLEHLSPVQQVQHLAFNKALSVQSSNDDIVISGDTVVEFQNQILGKPIDVEDAFRMVKLLVGNTHRVLSALCVSSKSKTIVETFVSEVSIKDVDDETVLEYIKLYHPLDKAGSYGIQDDFFSKYLLKRYSGYLNTIMGFPLEELPRLLKELTDD